MVKNKIKQKTQTAQKPTEKKGSKITHNSQPWENFQHWIFFCLLLAQCVSLSLSLPITYNIDHLKACFFFSTGIPFWVFPHLKFFSSNDWHVMDTYLSSNTRQYSYVGNRFELFLRTLPSPLNTTHTHTHTHTHICLRVYQEVRRTKYSSL